MMDNFGNLLRYYRRQSTDPLRGGMLTQERLGELIGDELGDAGYTAAAVSDWERGKSKISQADFKVLRAIIKVLVNCGGIKTPSEANDLLTLGNYRSLNDTEKEAIFGAVETPKSNGGEGSIQKQRILPLFFGDLPQSIGDEWEYLRALIKRPAPHTSSWVWDWLGHLGEQVSTETLFTLLIWAIPWLLTWAVVFPILRWPFENQIQTLQATSIYAAGSLAIPILIGGLTRTKNSIYWQTKKLNRSPVLRLYVYQGAFIGFHLGVFPVFAIRLALYYLGFEQFPLLVESLAAIFVVYLSQSAANQVPFNLWRAYERLELKDGAIFFIFVLFGPLESAFFFQFNGFLLSKTFGPSLLFAAAFLLIAVQAWQKRRTGTSVIPAHFWAAFFGALLVLYQATITPKLYPPLTVACVVAATVALLAWEYDKLTLSRAVFGFTVPLLLLLAYQLHWLLGLTGIITVAVLLFRWPKVAWIPWGFWAVMAASVTGAWLFARAVLPEGEAAIGLLLTTATILWLQKKLK